MQNFRIFISILCLSLSLCACDNRKEVTVLQEQTEAIHDHAMADLAAMVRTKTALRKELTAMDTIEIQLPIRDSILEVLTSMAKAQDDMSAWMLNYKAPTKETKKETAIGYLTEQKISIEKNATDISSATLAGKKCLEMIKKGNSDE